MAAGLKIGLALGAAFLLALAALALALYLDWRGMERRAARREEWLRALGERLGPGRIE